MNLNALGHQWRRMATIASIMLLISACSSGGSDQPSAAGTSTPALSTKAPAEATEPPRKTMTQPFDGRGIRRDVLATALAQMAVAPVNGKPARVALSEDYDGPSTKLPHSSLFIEHLIGPNTTGHELGRYVSDMFHTHDKPSEFHGIRTQMGISHAGPLPAATASSAPDDVVLTLGRKLIFTFEGRTRSGADNTAPTHESFTLSAPADAVIRRHDRYDKSGADGAIDWRSSDGDVQATFYLLRDFASEPGSTPENEFRLCMGMYRDRECTTCPPLLSEGRDVCTTWQVPDGWQAGQPLVPKNMFVTGTHIAGVIPLPGTR